MSEWKSANEWFQEEEDRRMADIPVSRPSHSIWALPTIWKFSAVSR